MIDPRFRVEVISQTSNPQQVIYAAMHQDYSEEFVYDELFDTKEIFSLETPEPTGRRWAGHSEQKCGEIIVDRLLAGNRGHYGCLEHPQITLDCGWFPHSVMQQIRTHRVAISFDVQSLRYTGQRIIDVVDGKRELEEVFYLRPLGEYTDRQGKRYEYTPRDRSFDADAIRMSALRYREKIEQGYSEEHARDLIYYAIRQHFVMSLNTRSLMHLLDLRSKLDAQLEAQQLCELIFPKFAQWVPAIADWYKTHRLGRAKLSP